MSYNCSLISPSPSEDPRGGSFLEESSGGGDDSNVLGGDSLVTRLLDTVLLVMCLTGVVGNIYTVAVASGRVAGCSAGSLGVYMINLALAVLLYLSTIPFAVCTSFAHDWFFGDVGCRLLLSLDLLTMHASVFLLTAMSLERYWAVAKPLRARRASNTHRKLASAFLWLLWLLLTVPMTVMTRLREGDSPHKRICIPTWTRSAFRLYLTVPFPSSVLARGAVLGIAYTRLARPCRSSACGLGQPVAGRALHGGSSSGSLPSWWPTGPASSPSWPGCTRERGWASAPLPRPTLTLVSPAWPMATAVPALSSTPCLPAAAAGPVATPGRAWGLQHPLSRPWEATASPWLSGDCRGL